MPEIKKYLDKGGLEVYNNAVDAISNGYVRSFDTVTAMQAATNLKSGMVTHTNGFHKSGDGGAAYYTINASGTANGMDVLELQDGLFASLVVTNPYVTPEMFGAWGDSTSDDSASFIRMFERVHSDSVITEYGFALIRKIQLTNGYNIGPLTIPDYYYNDLEFIGGSIYGSLIFGSKIFPHISFEGTNFHPASGYAVELSPNPTVEYKTIHFNNCNFFSGNGVNLQTRSINIHFTCCTFRGCEIAFNCIDCDLASFDGCWFDTKASNKALAYTIKQDAANESCVNFSNCIIVNASTALPTGIDFVSFIETNGIVNLNNSRVSNEGNIAFCFARYAANTPESIGGHRSGISIINCDINTSASAGIVHLDGIPSKISMYGCSGQSTAQPIITMNPEITDVYAVRPKMLIDVSRNDFTCLSIIKQHGNGLSSAGVNIPTNAIPSIPFELYFAVSHGHRGQTDFLIVPLTDGFKYDISPNTETPLFKLPIKGTVYNSLRANGKSFWVRYTTQVEGTNTWNTVMDVVTITESSGARTITKSNLFGEESSVTYALTPNNESSPTEYTVSITAASRKLFAIDYGIFNNGFASI